MQVFLSYASEDKDFAEQIQLALAAANHQIFFDAESLPPGGDYHSRIRDAVSGSDAFVFLISPSSVAQGSYALTELGFVRTKWVSPKDRVVPVVVRETPWEQIPNYLKAVTVMEPRGNIAAEVVSAITTINQSLSGGSVASATHHFGQKWWRGQLGFLGTAIVSFGLGGAAAGAMLSKYERVAQVSSQELLRSAGGPRQGVDVAFRNSSTKKIELFWLNPAGEEVSFKDVPPGSVSAQATFSGHPWLIKDAENGEPLLVVLPRSKQRLSVAVDVSKF